jgi:hypothetical protein
MNEPRVVADPAAHIRFRPERVSSWPSTVDRGGDETAEADAARRAAAAVPCQSTALDVDRCTHLDQVRIVEPLAGAE